MVKSSSLYSHANAIFPHLNLQSCLHCRSTNLLLSSTSHLANLTPDPNILPIYEIKVIIITIFLLFILNFITCSLQSINAHNLAFYIFKHKYGTSNVHVLQVFVQLTCNAYRHGSLSEPRTVGRRPYFSRLRQSAGQEPRQEMPQILALVDLCMEASQVHGCKFLFGLGK